MNDINFLGRTIIPSSIVANPIFTTPYTNQNSPFYSPPNTSRKFDPIVVTYNALTNNMLIGVSEGSLIFKAGEKIPYTFEKCSPNKLMWNQYTKWGLPNYMGFNKGTYVIFQL